jgi:hypothetical protein
MRRRRCFETTLNGSRINEPRRSPSPPTMPAEDPDQGKSAGSAKGVAINTASSKTE